MTGTIRANTVGPNTGGTLRALVRGVAAAWACLNGTGTIALRDSENISSVVDNGTGDYTFNFANDMDDANYSAVYGGYSGLVKIGTTDAGGVRSTSAYSQSTTQPGSSSQGSAADTDFVSNTIFGDLA